MFPSGVRLRAPRKPGPFNRHIIRVAQLKLMAAKRRLTPIPSCQLKDVFATFLCPNPETRTKPAD